MFEYTSTNNGVTSVKTFSNRDSFMIDRFIGNFHPVSEAHYGNDCEKKTLLVAKPVIHKDFFEQHQKLNELAKSVL